MTDQELIEAFIRVHGVTVCPRGAVTNPARTRRHFHRPRHDALAFNQEYRNLLISSCSKADSRPEGLGFVLPEPDDDASG